MPNIMVNEECNLKCSYCFSNEIIKENQKQRKEKNISLEDYKEIVDFITQTHSHIGILGGEPTLHPQIKEILEYLISNEKVQRATFFTNGINLDRVINQICNYKFGTLINLNSPEEIGTKRYAKIIENIDKLYFERYNNEFTLGINMHKTDFDYEYMINALQRYKKNLVRIALIAPYDSASRKVDYFDYCDQMKPRILQFFKKLEELNIRPNYDCAGNVIPPCLYNKEEFSFIENFAKKVSSCSNNGGSSNIANFPNCEFIPEFTVDKKAVRCIPLGKEESVPMNSFKNIIEIINYFKNRYDVFSYTVPIDEKCRDCFHMKTMQCKGGCLAYKIEQINQAREIASSIKKIKD